MELLEDHAAYTRTGTGGLAQIATQGLIAAAFDHYDSRAGDPNLHTHVAISSKVQGIDGKWRSLDARALYRMTVAASECYNTAFETALTTRLGVTFTPRPDTTNQGEPVREISHIPFGMIGHFSSRRARIETRYAQLVRAYRREHGHDPPRATCHQLARQANLDTGDAKKPARSLAEMHAAWRASLTAAFGHGAVRQLMAAVPGPSPAAARPPAGRAAERCIDIGEIAERVVANVATQRSTWTVWNLRAEAERIARAECSFSSLREHRDTVAAVVAEAVSPRLSVSVEAPDLLDEPPALRRGDGESVFTEHAADRYTSQAVLDAEQRLLAAARTPTTAGLAGPAVAAALDGYEAQTGRHLDPGQRHLVTAFAARSTLLAAGLGPAGSGKTTAMRALSHVLRHSGQRLIPLATSAAAADVLGRELGVRADNLHKFLHEHTRGIHAARLRRGGHLPSAARPYALNPGDVVLIDEAGMAGTFALDQLVRIAAQRGALVRLLGDDRQLSAVESGGALRLIAHDAGAAELTTLYRFADPAEASATLKLRTGDAAALEYYLARGRVRSGSREAMTEAAYNGWRADMLAGKTTLMTAASGTDVTALSAQARAERVEAGQVEPGGVPLRDGNLAGCGDWIVTRENNRRLATRGGRDWVKNGDAWRVIKRHRGGALRVEHLTHRGHVTLPPEYVATRVQLLYATTAHRAQGTTVDTAHALITPEMSRESFYVVASRARQATTFYTATHDLLPLDEDNRLDAARTDPRSYAAREVLENVLAREGAELSATETIRVTQEQAGSLATLVPRYVHAAQLLAGTRYREIAIQVLGPEAGHQLVADSAWGAIVRALHEAETGGWEPGHLLATVVDLRELETARDIAQVIAWRIDAHTSDHPAPPPHDQRNETPATRLPNASHGDPGRPSEKVILTAALAEETVTAVLGMKMASRARAEPAWPALHAALRRAQRRGHDPSALLEWLAHSRELRTARSICEVLAWRIGTHLASQPEPATRPTGSGTATPDPLLPWLNAPPPAAGSDGEVAAYLHVAAHVIRTRIRALTTDAARTRPDWMNALGTGPSDPGLHEKWLHHIGIVAAYRDQHQVMSNDPRQVLGPYAEPGHAGHTSYWHAAASVLAARTLAGLEPAPAPVDDTHAQVAADLYLGLPDAERAAVSAAIAERLGTLWFGTRTQTDDHAATRPMYAPHLAAALAERGLLTRQAALQEAQAGAAVTAPCGDEQPIEAAFAQRHPSPKSTRSEPPVRMNQPRHGRHRALRPHVSPPLRPDSPEPPEQKTQLCPYHRPANKIAS